MPKKPVLRLVFLFALFAPRHSKDGMPRMEAACYTLTHLAPRLLAAH